MIGWKLKKYWAEQTKKDRVGAFKNHIFPFIGDIPIDQITRQKLINIIERLKTDGKHSKTFSEIMGSVVSKQ